MQKTLQRQPKIKYCRGKAWLAVPKFEKHLLNELGLINNTRQNTLPNGTAVYGDLIYMEKDFPTNVFWVRTTMEKPFTVHFSSISEAAYILKSIQRNWALYPFKCFRRASLIQEKLPYTGTGKPKDFPYILKSKDMGLWTLLDENTIFASAETSSPFPLGEILFKEDKVNPPSRAYLKLWEAITLLQCRLQQALKDKNLAVIPKGWELPCRDSVCIDAGASPGGWTWVLSNLGAKVTAIDRSPLDARLNNHPNINFICHDAFTLKPNEFSPTDWVCSDVICYPPRLYEWIEKWCTAGLCNRFICTLKMQGEPDNKTVKKFTAIPNSVIVRLTSNKHELTWLKAPFLTS